MTVASILVPPALDVEYCCTFLKRKSGSTEHGTGFRDAAGSHRFRGPWVCVSASGGAITAHGREAVRPKNQTLRMAMRLEDTENVSNTSSCLKSVYRMPIKSLFGHALRFSRELVTRPYQHVMRCSSPLITRPRAGQRFWWCLSYLVCHSQSTLP